MSATLAPPTPLTLRPYQLEAAQARQAHLGDRLVSRPVERFRARPLHWVQAGPGRFVLPISDGRITLEQWIRGWTATLERYVGTPAVLGRDLPLEYAQGVAEDRVRAEGALHLVDPNAAWRRRPASDKQLAVLNRRGVRMRPEITAGEASDLIAAGMRGRTA